MKIHKVDLNDGYNIKIEYELLEKNESLGLLIKCYGKYGIGTDGNRSGNHLAAITAAGLKKWMTDYLVFDLREMEYTMSNSLGSAFIESSNIADADYKIYILVGKNSESGVRSLVKYMNSLINFKIINNIEEIHG